MSDETGGHVEFTASTELSNASAVEKAANTTQLDDRSVTTDTGRGIKPPYDPAALASFQELNGTHAVAIGKKAQWEVGFGFDIVPHQRAGDEPNESEREAVADFWFGRESTWRIGPEGTTEATPTEVLTLARRDYHGVGWAALEILTNNAGDPIGLAHVPATTVRVRRTERENGEIVGGHGYVQVKGQKTRYFGEAGDRWGDDQRFVDAETGDVGREVDNPANELLFIPNPSPLELYYGVPDWVAEIKTMVGDQAAKDYNRDFFEHSAIPYLAITVTNGQLTEQSREDLRGILHGLKDKPHRTVILEAEKLTESGEFVTEDGEPAQIEIQPLGLQQDEDMAFSDYREFNEHDVAKIHEVPPILLNRTESANRSNSREQIRAFAEEVIAPEQARFAARLYNVIHVAGLGAEDWTIEFELRGADNPERDANVAATRIQAGQQSMKVNEAREELGLDPLDGPIGEMLLAEVGGGGMGAGAAVEEAIAERVDEAREDLLSDVLTEGRIQGATADD